MEFIDLKSQYTALRPLIQARINAVLEHGRFIMGPEVEEVERELARRTGSRFAVACSSGTDALLIALMAIGVSSGDEVLTSPFSFAATAEVIALVGARPVFVDIDPMTYNIDAQLIETAITERTRAIVPVSLYGQCADMDRINEIATDRGLAVIEDAAQSFGATYKGRPSCNLSTIGCTSFFPSKPLGCYGDGGACFTHDEGLAARMRQIRLHGQDRRYHHSMIGINGRMDTLQAAVLLAKLEMFDQELKERARVAATYASLLRDSGMTPPYVEKWNTSVFAQYTIEVEERTALQERLKLEGIPTAVHYPTPLHLQQAFVASGVGPGSFPNAERAAERVLSIPMHPYLREPDQLRVVCSLKAHTPRANRLSSISA